MRKKCQNSPNSSDLTSLFFILSRLGGLGQITVGTYFYFLWGVFMQFDLGVVLNFSIVAVVFLISTVLVSAFLTKRLITLLPKLGLVDIPGGRHIHKNLTPKGGGLSFILTTGLCAILIILLLPPQRRAFFLSSRMDVFYFVAGGFVISLIGFLDDKYDISPKVKLFAQVVVATFSWYVGFKFNSIFGLELHPIVSYGITVFWIISFINAFNLIDGLDGLASGVSMISAGTLAIIFFINGNPGVALFLIILMGGLIGFLIYNFHPAKIFMGDTGSMFLGFTFAIICLVSVNKTATFTSILIPVLATGVPFFDVILAIWRRLGKRWLLKLEGKEGESKVMGADKEHLHHRIMTRAGSQRKTVTIIYSISVIFAVMAIVLYTMESRSKAMAYLFLFTVVAVLVRSVAYIEFHNSGKALVHGLHKPTAGNLLLILHPIYDSIVICASYVFFFKMFSYAVGHGNFESLSWFQGMVIHALPLMFVFFISGIYKIVWQYASGFAYMKVLRLIIFTSLFVMIFITVLGEVKWPLIFLLKEYCFMLTTLILILGERMIIRYFKTMIYHTSIKRHLHDEDVERVLIYGAGTHFRYLVDTLQGRQLEDDSCISTVIDDDSFMQGRHVAGFMVEGTIDDIEAIYEKKPFDKIMVTCELTNSNLRKLRQLSEKNSIPVVKWDVSENEVSL